MTHSTFSISGPSSHLLDAQIQITGSKSETNRLLLLQALFSGLTIDNISNSDDAAAMQKGVGVRKGTVDVYHAGTAMRFLTAFFATQEGVDILLTGSERMQQRPIGILVSALRALGADIEYDAQQGYPPLRIKGKSLEISEVSLDAGVSSQYISALLLVAPSLKNGLRLSLEGRITSVPYIKMTLALLDQIGVAASFEGQTITVSSAKQMAPTNLVVESDWSSASYYYSLVAMSAIGSRVCLSSYKEESLQGDAVLAAIYESMGVQTSFEGHSLVLSKISDPSASILQEGLSWDLANAPDIAQTIAVSCFGLGLDCHLTGLHTLKIKETDRLLALENELTKFGAALQVTEDSLHLDAFKGTFKQGVSVATYHDHRMAMAFAPLALRVPMQIEDAMVVKKSYPDFWEDLRVLGFEVTVLEK